MGDSLYRTQGYTFFLKQGKEVDMPWKECSVMDERIRFVARLLEGEKMASLCQSSLSPAKPATRSLTATKNAVWKP
jgi:hypothetical protein